MGVLFCAVGTQKGAELAVKEHVGEEDREFWVCALDTGKRS